MAARHMLSAVAAAALLLCHPVASALTLGRLTVQSALGEALVADIEVTSLSADEAASLKPVIAPLDVYRAAGVDFNSALAEARVKLLRRPDGAAFVRITGDRAVVEPFLDLILDFSWSGGRLQRAYTLLVDPRSSVTSPAVVAAPVMSVTPPAASASTVSASALVPAVGTGSATETGGAPAATPPLPVTQTEAAAAASAPVRAGRGSLRLRQRGAAAAAVPASAASEAASDALTAVALSTGTSSGEEYRVKQGDTLARIAQGHLPEGASLDQMLVSLYHGNQDAFMGRNMNRLKSGSVLTLPDAQAVRSVTSAEARRVIRTHSADFTTFRQTLANAAPQVAVQEPARQSAGKVDAAVQDQKINGAGAGDQLKLSNPAKPSSAEAQVSKQTERAAAQTRVAELSRNVDELKKLSGPGGAPAGAAPKGASQPAPSLLPALPVAPVVAPAVVPAPAVKPTVASTAPVVPVPAPVASIVAPAVTMPMVPSVASVASTASAAIGGASQAAPAASAAPAGASAASGAASQAVRRVAAPVPTPEPEGDILDTLSDFAIPIGAGVVALLLGLGAMRFWKRKRGGSTETSFIESKLQADSFFGASGGQRVDTRESSAPSSSSLSYSLSQLDAIGDVDPVAEADVYLAYGRDLQAEEILKEALRSDPNRLAIRVKLLEVYAKREDTRSFDAQLQQVRELTGAVGDEWEHALELGRQLDPGNPQYQFTGSGVSVDLDTSIGEMSELPDDPMPTLPAPHDLNQLEDASNDMGLDIDLASPAKLTGLEHTRPVTVMQPPAELPSTLGAADLHGYPEVQATSLQALPDLAELEGAIQVPPMSAAPAPAPAASNELGSLDFDFSGLSLDLGAGQAAPAPAVSPVSPDEMLSFDLSGMELPAAAGEDESLMQKIDLADEFRQIGDDDGARDLLQEVVARGSASQRARAQAILNEMS